MSKILGYNKDFERLYVLEKKLGVEIVSYGLAPNPWGYVYEVMDQEKWDNSKKIHKDELNFLCNNSSEEYIKIKSDKNYDEIPFLIKLLKHEGTVQNDKT